MEERYENAAVTWTQQFCRINSFLGAGKREAVFLAEKILKESCDATVTVMTLIQKNPISLRRKYAKTPNSGFCWKVIWMWFRPKAWNILFTRKSKTVFCMAAVPWI